MQKGVKCAKICPLSFHLKTSRNWIDMKSITSSANLKLLEHFHILRDTIFPIACLDIFIFLLHGRRIHGSQLFVDRFCLPSRSYFTEIVPFRFWNKRCLKVTFCLKQEPEYICLVDLSNLQKQTSAATVPWLLLKKNYPFLYFHKHLLYLESGQQFKVYGVAENLILWQGPWNKQLLKSPYPSLSELDFFFPKVCQ